MEPVSFFVFRFLSLPQGVLTYLDGSRYEGHFQEGAMHGEVRQRLSKGRSHVQVCRSRSCGRVESCRKMLDLQQRSAPPVPDAPLFGCV